ncbi:MAG: Ig-like domain-containing protein [Candidatus Hydrogenedentes bacterium]|nr:Ig-like domain-containing protein [Candidatus Hydrogenedentota bacterium]
MNTQNRSDPPSRGIGRLIRILACLFIVSGFGRQVCAADPSELRPYLRTSTVWHCAKLDKDVPLNVYYITRSTHSRPWNIGSPVIVYVKNHGEKRIGLEPDAPILMDYLKQRYIVITVDFEHDPRAVSPFFDHDLHDIFSAIYGYNTTSLLEDAHLEPRQFRCFFLPAGYRVATDLVFWELDKYGANGTMEYIMDFYNREIAGVVTGKERVSDPSEMTDRQGRPFQYKLAMDIVYRSQPNKTVPLVFYTSTQVTRHPNVAPATYRPHMMGFTMSGYAYAIIDHCYNPIRRHFWFMPGKYSLDRWNGLACYTAAIRFIRAHADKYNIDGRYIGGMGHSKGQYSITRLSDLHHEEKGEAARFKGFPAGSPEPQPWQGYSSRITVGYQSPGNHAEFITRDYVPTIVAHGSKDSLGKGYRAFFDRLNEFDINHISLYMRGLGHELPYGYDDELGVDRYELVHKFFDQYLKVEDHLPPVVLYMTPPDRKTGVAPSEPIILQFAPVMDSSSIIDGHGVKIIRSDNGTPVQGSWTVSRQSTRFTFTPENDLEQNVKYKVVVATDVKNKAGTPLAKTRTAEFTVGKQTSKKTAP